MRSTRSSSGTASRRANSARASSRMPSAIMSMSCSLMLAGPADLGEPAALADRRESFGEVGPQPFPGGYRHRGGSLGHLEAFPDQRAVQPVAPVGGEDVVAGEPVVPVLAHDGPEPGDMAVIIGNDDPRLPVVVPHRGADIADYLPSRKERPEQPVEPRVGVRHGDDLHIPLPGL